MTRLTNLIALRKTKHLTQAEAAEALDVSVERYGSWERGCSQPKIEGLIQMADFFQTTIDFIVGRKHKTITPYERRIVKKALLIVDKKADLSLPSFFENQSCLEK